METYIEFADSLFGAQVDGFCKKVGNHQGLLGLDPVKIHNLAIARNFLLFELEQNEVAQQYLRSHTSYKNLLRFGMEKQVLGPLPTPPVYPLPVLPLPNANVQAQFAELIQNCTHSSAFTEAIGLDLGIIKLQTQFLPEKGTPNLTGKTSQGGHPLLHAKIGEYEAFEIWKDDGGGLGYKLCGTALHPEFTDASTLPPYGTTTTWKYKAIYLYKGKIVGNWSNQVLVTVYGVI